MRFARFKEDSVGIISRKEYKIQLETVKDVSFSDEDNDIRIYSKDNPYFEIIDRPVMVKAWDYDACNKEELELIHDLGESFEYRYVCVCEDKIANVWKHIEYIEEPTEELTLEQRIENLEQIIKQINK